jgi:predicted transposase YbfD/YdcC
MSECIDSCETKEPNRDRFEIRKVEVYDDLYDIDIDKWIGIKEIIKVTRTTYNKNNEKDSIDESFYVSSIKMSAKEYNLGIRSHWGIENSLHYVKDVTFGEDSSLIRTGNAPTNFSIIRNIVVNVIRREKYLTFPQAIRMIGGDIKKLAQMLV